MLTVRIFSEVDKVEKDENCKAVVTYKYLGIDNNTLRIEREELEAQHGKKETSQLFFKLNKNRSIEITLIGQEYWEGSLIKLRVEATNNYIKVNYIGELPRFIKQ
jgi:hypothetical protein